MKSLKGTRLRARGMAQEVELLLSKCKILSSNPSFRTRDMTQAVECLLCKCKAVSSNPRLTKNKKKVAKPLKLSDIKRNL
jgi:hypothetical protein